MSVIVQTITKRVSVAGVEVAALAVQTSHGTDQPIGACDISVVLPLPAAVQIGAQVVVEAARDGVWFDDSLFNGAIRAIDLDLDLSGRTARIRCEGWNHLMALGHPTDVAYGGGAGTTPAAAGTPPEHLGLDTIAWYADPVPTGVSDDITWTPAVDSQFVIIAGRTHGANSYPETFEGDITNWSRCEIRQAGNALGYANLPVNQERFAEELDYTDDQHWEDFSLLIAAEIRAVDGTVTRRFIAGRKPGSNERDNFEIKAVTRATAAAMTARSIIRGLYAKRGFGASGNGISYEVDELVSISGVIIRLGGNGLIDAGQTRIEAGDAFLRWIVRVAGLFGYRCFDTPAGVPRVQAVRGKPLSGASVATFTEGTNAFRVRRVRDVRPVVNYWRVLGASGTDPDGTRVQYRSEPDPETVPSNPAIPDPPGWVEGEVSDRVLVSDTLCLYVRHIREIDYQDEAVIVEWESYGHDLRPGQVVTVDAPTIGFAGPLWLTSIAHDIDTAGHVCRLTGWAGSGTPLPEPPDPDPDEDDIEPGAPIPRDQWRPYWPKNEGAA